MQPHTIDAIKNDPNYRKLIKSRTRFTWTLTLLMLAVYFAFILLIAYAPQILGTPLVEGSVTTVGIPVGIGVIVFAIVLTAIYTRRANSEFDALVAQITSQHQGI